MNTKFTKTVAVTGLTVSAFVAVCGFTNTAFADEAPAVVNTPVVNDSKNQNPQNKLQNLFKSAQPQAENKKAEENQELEPIDDNTVTVAAGLVDKTLDEFEEYARSVKKKLSEEQRTLYKTTLENKIKTLEKTYSEALDYAETLVKYDVQGADGSLKAAAEEFLKNRDNFKDKSFADSDLKTINNVWKSSDEFNKKITAKNLKNAIAQAKQKASKAAQSGTAGSQVESPASPAAPVPPETSSPAPASPAPASPQAPKPADSEKNEAPSSQDAPSADAPSAGAPSAGAPSASAPSAGASSEDEISDLDIEDDWLKEISDYLESSEFDDLNLDDFDLSDLDDFNLDDFNLDDIDLSNLDDFNLDDFDFSDIDLNA